MATGGNGIDGTEYRTTEVRLRRPLPENKLASPDADPHVLKVRQPAGSISSSTHSRECSIEGGEIVIEYSGHLQRPISQNNSSDPDYRAKDTILQTQDCDAAHCQEDPAESPRPPQLMVMQTHVTSDGEEGENELMLLQTPEQLRAYQRNLIMKDTGREGMAESSRFSAENREVFYTEGSRTTSPAPSAISGAPSYSVVSVTDDDTSEYKELNNATLRRYYGDVTPYGTIARVRNQTQAGLNGGSPPSSDTVGYEGTSGNANNLPDTSHSTTLRSNKGYGTLIRRNHGGFYTRLPEAEPFIGNIGYIDFLPRRTKKRQSLNMSSNFEKFKNCVNEANKFLEQNPDVSVRNCESLIQRLDHNHHINSESTTSHDRSHVIGLRLWYAAQEGERVVPSDTGRANGESVATETTNSEQTERQKRDLVSSQEKSIRPRLCYRNVIPEYKIKDRPKDKPRKHHDCPSFENMKETLDKLNANLLENPIKGKLVNVECVPINYSHAFHGNGEIDPDIGYWCLDFQGHWNVFIIRIYYLEGHTFDNYEIDFEDFAPAPIKITPSCPEFQGFSALSSNASRWLSRDPNRHVTVVGTQTVELPFRLKRLVADKGKIDTLRSCYEPSKISAYWNTVRVLRIWYIRPRGMKHRQDRLGIGPSRRGIGGGPGIAVRTFTPCQITTPGCCGLRKPMFASTQDTVIRINEWASLTGAEVMGIQTDNVEKWRGKRCELGRPLEDRTYNKQDFPTSLTASSLDYRLTLFRVFIRSDSRGGFAEPGENEYPPCPPPVEPCCCFVGCTIM